MESKIVTTYRTIKNYVNLGICCGWTWIPCFCAGLVCLITAKDVECTVTNKLRDIIEWYSADTLKVLGPRVRAQHDLFITACTNVNEKATKIFPNVNLIDAICAYDTTFGAVFNERKYSFDLSFLSNNNDKDDKNKYLLDVYKEYIRLNGDSAPVIYGLPEYLAILYDPTCDIMLRYYDDITKPSQLSWMIMRYKTKAGF